MYSSISLHLPPRCCSSTLPLRPVRLSLFPVTNALQAAGRMLIFEGAVVNNYAFYEDSTIECMSDGVGS